MDFELLLLMVDRHDTSPEVLCRDFDVLQPLAPGERARWVKKARTELGRRYWLNARGNSPCVEVSACVMGQRIG